MHILEDGKQVCPGLLSLNLMRNLGISLELSEREASVWNQNTYEYEPLEVLGRNNDHMYLDLFSGLSSEGVEPWTEEQLDVWVGRSQIPKEEFRFGPALWTYEEYKQRWKNPKDVMVEHKWLKKKKLPAAEANTVEENVAPTAAAAEKRVDKNKLPGKQSGSRGKDVPADKIGMEGVNPSEASSQPECCLEADPGAAKPGAGNREGSSREGDAGRGHSGSGGVYEAWCPPPGHRFEMRFGEPPDDLVPLPDGEEEIPVETHRWYPADPVSYFRIVPCERAEGYDGEDAVHMVDVTGKGLKRRLRKAVRALTPTIREPPRVLELFSWSGTIGQVAREQGWSVLPTIDLLTGWDLLQQKCQDQLISELPRWRPHLCVIAFPCTPWSRMQNMNRNNAAQEARYQENLSLIHI